MGDEAALRALEERLDRAAAAAERLLAEAGAAAGAGAGAGGAAGAGAGVPPRGWQRRTDESEGDGTVLGGWLSAPDAELLVSPSANRAEIGRAHV